MTDAADPLSQAIGLRLRGLREERNLTQWDVARAAGIERGSLANLEGGRLKVGLRTLVTLASYFGVSLDYLVHGHDASDDHMPPRSKVAILWGWLTDAQRDELLVQISSLVRANVGAAQRSGTRPSTGRPKAVRARSRSARGSAT